MLVDPLTVKLGNSAAAESWSKECKLKLAGQVVVTYHKEIRHDQRMIPFLSLLVLELDLNA